MSPVATAIASSVSVKLTVIGPVYTVEDVVGVRSVGRVVDGCARGGIGDAHRLGGGIGPGGGEKAGVEPKGLWCKQRTRPRWVSPVTAAIALSVSVELTVIGPVYTVEDVVGVLPSVV